MANIPTEFYNLTHDEKREFAIKKMNMLYKLAEEWKQIRVAIDNNTLNEPNNEKDNIITDNH
jgi:predicted hydrocarbon binding protein